MVSNKFLRVKFLPEKDIDADGSSDIPWATLVVSRFNFVLFDNCQVLRHVGDCGALLAFIVSGILTIHATTVTRADKQTSQS